MYWWTWASYPTVATQVHSLLIGTSPVIAFVVQVEFEITFFILTSLFVKVLDWYHFIQN